MLTIGLTGGIGSGKSTLARLLAERGATRIDADAISRRLTGVAGDAIPAIRAAFGDGAIAANGAMDRAAVRALVFADAALRAKLEAILHPMIQDVIFRQRREARGPYIVEEVPLLVEKRLAARFSRVLVVDVPRQLQFERVRARNAFSDRQIEEILRAQCSRRERLDAADDVVFNGVGLERLEAAADALHARYLRIASGSGR